MEQTRTNSLVSAGEGEQLGWGNGACGVEGGGALSGAEPAEPICPAPDPQALLHPRGPPGSLQDALTTSPFLSLLPINKKRV